MTKIDSWWTSLKTKEKERIGRKITGHDCPYPECTKVWLALESSKKKKIYEHCIIDHRLIQEDWSEGKTFSY